MKYLKYLRYLCRHKWFVFVECCRLGIPFAGIVHDWSKFLPSEFVPYAETFYGTRKSTEALDAIGEFGRAELAPHGYFARDRFHVAWNWHQKRNPHHWQFWILLNDDSTQSPLPMPERYRREMFADWVGAGRAITGKRDVVAWFERSRPKMQLHPETAIWIEDRMALERKGQR